MSDWYFIHGTIGNPGAYTGHDGTSPEKGWVMSPAKFGQYEGAIDTSVMSPGDTLWVLDTHTWSGWGDLVTNGSFPGIEIRGDYPGRPGVMKHFSIGAGSHGASMHDLTLSHPSDIALGVVGSSNVSLYNLDITAYRQCVRFTRDSSCDNIHIHDCEIYGGVEGIECFALPDQTRDGWIVENNHIYDIGVNYETLGGQDNEGLGFQRITNSVIRNNHIHHCHYGINIWESGSASVNNVEISDNYIHDILHGPQSWPSRGILFSGGFHGDGSMYNVVIQGNVLYNIGREGIRVQEPDSGAFGLVIRNNSIGKVNQEFGSIGTQYITGYSKDWTIYGNTTHEGVSMSVYEVAIAAHDFGRVKMGDIILAREPLGVVGKREQADFLWLVIETDLTIDELVVREEAGYKFGRYVDLEDLNNNGFSFDLSKVQDPEQNYQPGFDIDPVVGVLRSSPVGKNIDGLIKTRS